MSLQRFFSYLHAGRIERKIIISFCVLTVKSADFSLCCSKVSLCCFQALLCVFICETWCNKSFVIKEKMWQRLTEPAQMWTSASVSSISSPVLRSALALCSLSHLHTTLMMLNRKLLCLCHFDVTVNQRDGNTRHASRRMKHTCTHGLTRGLRARYHQRRTWGVLKALTC